MVSGHKLLAAYVVGIHHFAVDDVRNLVNADVWVPNGPIEDGFSCTDRKRDLGISRLLDNQLLDSPQILPNGASKVDTLNWTERDSDSLDLSLCRIFNSLREDILLFEADDVILRVDLVILRVSEFFRGTLDVHVAASASRV